MTRKSNKMQMTFQWNIRYKYPQMCLDINRLPLVHDKILSHFAISVQVPIHRSVADLLIMYMWYRADSQV